jgi:hypothetical protein
MCIYVNYDPACLPVGGCGEKETLSAWQHRGNKFDRLPLTAKEFTE